MPVTQGRRVYADLDGELLLGEGDYGVHGRSGEWMCRPPGSHAGSLAGHEVTEHEDGTITVSPSILIDDGRSKWHGYLRRGVWEAC